MCNLIFDYQRDNCIENNSQGIDFSKDCHIDNYFFLQLLTIFFFTNLLFHNHSRKKIVNYIVINDALRFTYKKC